MKKSIISLLSILLLLLLITGCSPSPAQAPAGEALPGEAPGKVENLDKNELPRAEAEEILSKEDEPPSSQLPPDSSLCTSSTSARGMLFLIQAPGKAVLIDGGPRAAGRKLVEYLKQAGISSIDLVISTHPHEDHIGGLISVLKAFPVGEVIDLAVVHTTRTFEEYLTLIDEKDIKFTEGRAGMSRELGGGAVLEILHPASPSAKHLHNASIVVRLTYGEVSFLFTGDAEKEAEAKMLKRGLNLAGTVLKIGHHGSRTSTTGEFLKAVAPAVAVIMCGKDNLYGHPQEETLKKLADAGVEIYRTDLHGTIVITTNGQAYDVNIERP